MGRGCAAAAAGTTRPNRLARAKADVAPDSPGTHRPHECTRSRARRPPGTAAREKLLVSPSLRLIAYCGASWSRGIGRVRLDSPRDNSCAVPRSGSDSHVRDFLQTLPSPLRAPLLGRAPEIPARRSTRDRRHGPTRLPRRTARRPARGFQTRRVWTRKVLELPAQIVAQKPGRASLKRRHSGCCGAGELGHTLLQRADAPALSTGNSR